MPTDEFVYHRSQKFGKVPELLLHDTSISDGAIRLYAHMQWRAGQAHKSFESQQTMGTRMGVGKQTIKKRITELEQRDWVVTLGQNYSEKTGKYSTHVYHIFEVQTDCIQFREQSQGKRIKPKSHKINPRKSRKGVGGNPAYRVYSSSNGDGVNDDATKTATESTRVDVTESTQVDTYPYKEKDYPDEKIKDSATADAAAPAKPKAKPKKLTPGLRGIFKGFAKYYKNATQDKIVECFGWSWTSMTKSNKGIVLRAAKELREVGIAIEDIPSVYEHCKKKFDDSFGPMALSSNYSAWLKANPASGTDDANGGFRAPTEAQKLLHAEQVRQKAELEAEEAAAYPRTGTDG